MATQKKKNTKPSNTTKAMPVEAEPAITVQKVVKDERVHKITGFFLVLVAVFLGIAFISYAGTWQQDQDKVFKAGGNFLFDEDIKVENRLGRLGAWISHLFIWKGFGLASFFLCLLPFTVGINLIFKQRIFRVWHNVFYALTGLVYFSVSLAFFTRGANFSYGGGWGEWLSESLTAFLGGTGMVLLLLVLGVAWVIWRFNPVFRVPRVPRVKMPEFSQRKVAPAPVALAGEATEPEPEAEPVSQPAVEAAQKAAPAALAATAPVAPAAGTGRSINDIYAEGRHTELASRNKYNLEDEPNPLDRQTVKATGNELSEGESSAVVVLPPVQQPAKPADPVHQFKVNDTVDANIPLTVIPALEEPTTLATATTPPSVVPDAPPHQAELAIPYDNDEIMPPPAKAPQAPVVKPNPATTQPEAGTASVAFEIKNPGALQTAEEAEAEEQQEEPARPPVKVENLEPYDPKLELRGYEYPSLELLDTHGSEKIVTDATELEAHKNQILNTLKNYDISIQRISATVGPTVTLYEIVPAPGVRISRIKNLEDDIALSLAALGIRIIAPIPGRGTIGIEVPNVRKTIVSMRTLLASDKFQSNNFSLPIAIGKKIDNENFVVDLASMPHLLMAGATGQGKSVGINAVLVSLLYKKHPSQLKLVLVDPKKVELSLYRAIERHFLAKLPGEEEAIITDTKKVINTLNALCIEMDNRYDLLKEANVRNIREYNEKFVKRRLNPEKGHQFLPFIVLVIDEFADLIMTAGKEVEMPIARLAQLARAVGIHLIIATQRPSVNIITGTIKANFPSRMAFKVSSKIDSRTILDAGGAEQLIGKGDMLISHNGELIRLQCAFVDTPEVERICEAIGTQRGYPDAFLLPEYVDEKEAEARDFDLSDRDSLFDEAAKLIVAHQQGSTSLIQRRMKLGYNRAGRLMDQLEKAGIVGPNQGSKPRDVLVKTEMELLEILERF
ncbi:MAG: DNA translocase FtsK [Chitinophagaceae bacterium]|nr:DNA translocase FtsK [Chitinophagaceae bacterium]